MILFFLIMLNFEILPHQVKNYWKSPKITRNHWKLPKTTRFHQKAYIGPLLCTGLRYWPKCYLLCLGIYHKSEITGKWPNFESYVLEGTTKITSNWKSPVNAGNRQKQVIRVIGPKVIVRQAEANEQRLPWMLCTPCLMSSFSISF